MGAVGRAGVIKVGAAAAAAACAATVSWVAAGWHVERQHRVRQAEVFHRMRALTVAAVLYAQDHEETFPPAENWEAGLRPYLDAARRPAVLGSTPAGNPADLPPSLAGQARRIAINRAVAGRRIERTGRPSDVVLFFETARRQGGGATADLDAMLAPDVAEQLIVGYADGHVEDYYRAAHRDGVIRRSRAGLAP